MKFVGEEKEKKSESITTPPPPTGRQTENIARNLGGGGPQTSAASTQPWRRRSKKWNSVRSPSARRRERDVGECSERGDGDVGGDMEAETPKSRPPATHP